MWGFGKERPRVVLSCVVYSSHCERCFWCDPVASMTVNAFLSLLLARVSGPNIGLGLSGKNANKTPDGLAGPTVLGPSTGKCDLVVVH